MNSNEAREKVRLLWDAYRRERNLQRKAELYAEFKKARDAMYNVLTAKD